MFQCPSVYSLLKCSKCAPTLWRMLYQCARWCLLSFIIILCYCKGGVSRSKDSTFRPRTVLPEHYVKEIRPPSPRGKPVTVDFSIYIVDINSINVEDMDFR
ncbi:uncharacterized protein CBL_07785 [Carabus blaptoides fortunei]